MLNSQPNRKLMLGLCAQATPRDASHRNFARARIGPALLASPLIARPDLRPAHPHANSKDRERVRVTLTLARSALDCARLSGGKLSVISRQQNGHQQRFTQSNSINRRSTVATTIIRSGDALNLQNSDFDSIKFGSRASHKSAHRSFWPSYRESNRCEFAKFADSG